MAKPARNRIELGDASDELAKRFLPDSLKSQWLVLPERSLRWSLTMAASFMLLGGFLLGVILSTYIASDYLMWIGLVLFTVPIGVRKFVVGPLEDQFEETANQALDATSPGEAE